MECIGAHKVENFLALQSYTYKGTVNWNLGRGDFSIYSYLILEKSDRNGSVYLSKVHQQPKYFKIISQLKNCDNIYLRIYKRKSFSLLKTAKMSKFIYLFTLDIVLILVFCAASCQKCSGLKHLFII